MDITQIVFSPTGGTQRVADIVAAGLGTPANRIDLTAPGFDGSGAVLKGTDTVLIAVPSYGRACPRPCGPTALRDSRRRRTVHNYLRVRQPGL